MWFNTKQTGGNMDTNLTSRVSQIIEIEDDVIDLDGSEKTPEEVIYEWDAKIRKKLSMFAVADSESVLGDLMKEYLQSLQDMAKMYEENESLKNKVFCHISFLYSYYVELQCCTPDNYLSNMEDVLTVYCNLELEVMRNLKRKDFSKREYKRKKTLACRRMIHMLTVYLLERHDHILHVLIKMNTVRVSEICSEVLNVLYMHFLTKVPAFNLCDESFCRSYIVFQKWKEIRKVEDWEDMDKTMYKMFKRTPESIKDNETLKQILMPACESTVGIVFNLFRSYRDIANAYFKHITAKKNTEMEDLDFNIDLGDDEPIIPNEDENDEEVTFLRAYYEIERNMSNLPTNGSSLITELGLFRQIKEEDEDDDVEFVGFVTPEPPVSKESFIFNDDNENCCRKDTTSKTVNVLHDERVPAPRTPSPPPLTAKEKALEHLNGITRISSSAIPPPLCSVSGEPEESSEPVPSSPVPESTVCEISSVQGNVTDLEQTPKVSLVSSTTQVPSPVSSAPVNNNNNKLVNSESVKSTKSVEVQANIGVLDNKNHVYNDYGLTTPPFDVQTDEPGARTVDEPCLYTSIGQRKENDTTGNRSVEVQAEEEAPAPSVDKHCHYDDYGLTPPNDRPEETCLYDDETAEIGGGEKAPSPLPAEPQVESREGKEEVDSQINIRCDCDNALPNTTEEETGRVEVEEYEETDHVDTSMAESDGEEACVESCQEDNLLETVEDPSVIAEQIDTGQPIANTAPNIVIEEPLPPPPPPPLPPRSSPPPLSPSPPSPPSSSPLPPAPSDLVNGTKDYQEIVNGNTILKPLVTSNRDSSPAKIMYTSTQKIKASLDDFSKFETSIHTQWSKMKENHDLDKVFSGPVSKLTPAKHNLLNSQDRLDIFDQNPPNSRSNSPTEMTSPAYEGIDDFRNYFSDRVNGGRVAPGPGVPPPPLQSILKKSNGTSSRKNLRIMFHESCDSREHERRLRPVGEAVLVPKRVRRDRKLNMEPRVVVERLSFIENHMKKVLNHPPTLRVDYDKTTMHINEKDVVRCVSPPRLSWIFKSSTTAVDSSRRLTGSLTVKNREHLEKKPKKRKSESPNNSTEEPAITRKRAFRTSKKKSLGVTGSPRKRGKPSSTTKNNFVSKSDSEFDKLLNSGSYSNKPFRLDLTS